MNPLTRNTILLGDAETRLREIPQNSVDCIISSPPFYMLRDYGVAGQIGTEDTIHGWVARMVAVFDQLARVLTPTGVVWWDVGDSFSSHRRFGAPRKGLLLAPERLLLALVRRGWIARGKVVWWKANPLPTSVRDRLNMTYDVVYLLVRQPKYHFNLDAIRVPHRSNRPPTRKPTDTRRPSSLGPLAASRGGLARLHAEGRAGHPLGKNPGDVWRLSSSGYRGGHAATFPESLVERPLLASCPAAVCTACGASRTERDTPTCQCGAATRPGLVLDPFIGSGTVAVVAERHGRDWIGIELNPAYVELAQQRLAEAANKRSNTEGGDDA